MHRQSLHVERPLVHDCHEDRVELLLEEFDKILAGGRVKIVSVVHLSNSLGTINDVKRIAEMAHGVGALVMLDGAQWVAHHPTDVNIL